MQRIVARAAWRIYKGYCCFSKGMCSFCGNVEFKSPGVCGVLKNWDDIVTTMNTNSFVKILLEAHFPHAADYKLIVRNEGDSI